MPSRRHFIQLAGAGAAAALASRRAFAAEPASENQPAKPASKRTYDLGVASYSFRSFPRDRMWQLTKRAGLKHVCIHPKFHLALTSTPEQIAEVAAEAKAAGFDLYGTGVIYMNTPAEVDQAFQYAKALGVRVIVGVPRPDVLPLTNEKVQKYDIRVAIHNHGPGDKTYPTPDVAYERIKNLDPRVGLCMDIGHTVRAGMDPCRVAEQCADRLFDVHMKDVNVATGKGYCVEAGRGVIDIPKFIRTMDKIGYAGFLSFEYEKDDRDPLPGLAESAGYLRGVMAAI